MARFCNYSCNENATMRSVCTIEVHVTTDNIAAPSAAQKLRIFIFGGNKT